MAWYDYSAPGLAAGLFGGGGGGGSSDPYAGGYAAKKQINLNVLYPLLMQGMMASVAAGQSPTEFMQQFMVSKQGMKDAKKSGTESGILKIGKDFFDIGALGKALPSLLEKAQTAQIEQFNLSAQKLGQSPAFAGIWNEAAGNFAPDFTADINKAYEEMGNAALGAGAKSGFLLDPNKQAAALGPLALQKAQFLKSVQKSAESQKLGLLGAGGLASSNPSMQLGSSPAGAYQSGIFNVAQMQQQGQQFQQQMGFQQNAFQKQFYGDIFGGLLGGIGGAAFGGGGGGGGGGSPGYAAGYT